MNAPDLRAASDPKAQVKKRIGRFILPVLTIVLAGAGLALWKGAEKPRAPHSPLEPRSATLTVPVDKPMLPTKILAAKALPQPVMVAVPTKADAGGTEALPTPATASATRVVETAEETAPKGNGLLRVILERLTKIDSAIADLHAAVDRLNANAANGANTSTTAKITGNSTDIPAPIRTRHRMPHRARVKHDAEKSLTANAAGQVPRGSKSIQAGPDVLSVDTWNGRTSVAVRSGGEVSFLTEGDHAGNYELKRADKVGQRAFFIDPDGKLLVKDREVRQ